MSAVGTLALLQARRDRWELAVWIGGIAGLGFAAATAISTQFGADNERAALITVAAASPAFLFLRGLPDGISTGAVTFFQGYSFMAVLAGLMSTFLVIRHTRDDEDQGRAEFIGSTPVPRPAPLYAALLLGLSANAMLALTVAVGFIAAGLPVRGSLLAGAAVGGVGLLFTAAAAGVAQIMPSARSANGTAAALVGVAYLMRGAGDSLGTPDQSMLRVVPGWPSLFLPIGWGQRIRPYTDTDLSPLLVLTGAALVLAAVAVTLRKGRDLGDSYIHARDNGPERAGPGIRSVMGLAWRLQRGTLVGWCFTAAVLGLVAGALGPVIRDALVGNPSIAELISRLVPVKANMIDLFTTAMLGLGGVMAAAAGIQAVLRLRVEEVEGRAELLLSVPTPRIRWLTGTLAVAALSTAAIPVITGAVAATVLAVSQAGGSSPDIVVAASLAHVPAALVFPALTALVFAFTPRLSSPVGWAALGVALVLAQFGELLGLPAWLRDLSPFRHSSAMPVETFNLQGALLMSGTALIVAALAGRAIYRRDLAVP
ncbi:polyketide antibiotic transporter [Paenarthrobacter ureafaciens]|uniref:ABC transporter permease n=2 Tax=Micrococcaceae TaxID=1268 RepID=UPI0015BF3E3B|nr:polyketide antibiotic transporter [Paenarthrobacter ureafaciens]NWL26203.1 polyketide antibiotic transporter [Paenarthrobacter ureafaciens]QSZ52027.1 polyketide antibiotic transporter [Paenarthrobacter ureafaciens]